MPLPLTLSAAIGWSNYWDLSARAVRSSLTVLNSLAVVERLIANGYTLSGWVPSGMEPNFILDLPITRAIRDAFEHDRGNLSNKE
jgi:hypothetical protein